MFEAIAAIFIILLIASVFYGYGIVMRRPKSREEIQSEKCTICRERHPKNLLVERQIGDSKILYFCRRCIAGLAEESRLHVSDDAPGETPQALQATRMRRKAKRK